MQDFDYDLFVIGGGSGGVRGARIAAQLGARTALAESYRMGGTCVIRGCVPKKYLVYASEYGAAAREARSYGWQGELPRFHWPSLRDAVQTEVSRLSGIYTQLLSKAGVDHFLERARLIGPHEILLEGSGKTVTAKKILIAVGGQPWKPDPGDVPGMELTISSNEAFLLDRLPNSIIIAGGGYIACEFAAIFNGFGVDTALIYRGPLILRGFDHELREKIQSHLQKSGVKLVTNQIFNRIDPDEKKGEQLLVGQLSGGKTIAAEQIMMAVGRRPATQGLGLKAAGVITNDQGAIEVDAWSRTNVDHIFAVGDVTDRINLTPVAIREAAAAAHTMFGKEPKQFEHENVAAAVFTQPQLATVGLTEEQAKEKYGDEQIKIYRSTFRTMKTILYAGKTQVFLKLITLGEAEKIIGAHLFCPDAAELIQLLAVAVKAGLNKEQLDETCAVHPTLAEELVTLT